MIHRVSSKSKSSGCFTTGSFFLFPVSYGFESPRDFRTFFNTDCSSVYRVLLLSVSISYGSVSSRSESPGDFGTFFYAGSSSQYFVSTEDFGVLFTAGSSFSLSESSRSMLRNSGDFGAFFIICFFTTQLTEGSSTKDLVGCSASFLTCLTLLLYAI